MDPSDSGGVGGYLDLEYILKIDKWLEIMGQY